MKKTALIVLFSVLVLQASCQNKSNQKEKNMNIEQTDKSNSYYSLTDTSKIDISDAEWKKVLSPDVYAVSREKDTERPFTGKYWDYTGHGTYHCAACGNTLFRSDAKFASMCGWPSFFEQKDKNSVVYEEDNSHGMKRIEALCGRCGGHLGHLFDDGPAPTHKRYCMNSIVLNFIPDNKNNK